jgi:hypothetical protein
MPYFSVRVNDQISKEFVVLATNREAVEDILATAMATNKYDNKKILHIRTDTDSSMSVYDSDKTQWTDALKKQKAK